MENDADLAVTCERRLICGFCIKNAQIAGRQDLTTLTPTKLRLQKPFKTFKVAPISIVP